MRVNLGALLGLFAISTGLKTYSKESQDDSQIHGRDLTVFPPDDRVEYDPYKLQRGVGLLSYVDGDELKNCTATLVNRELILTAASCVTSKNYDVDGNIESHQISQLWKDTMQFHFGYSYGKNSPYNAGYKKAFVPQQFLDLAPNWNAHNFAIIQLNKALGDVTEFMQVSQILAKNYVQQGVNLVSYMYKNGTTASAVYCCKIIGNIDGLAKHLCDTTIGSEGAPLYVQSETKTLGKFVYTIMAMNNQEGLDYNLAAATKPIYNLLQYAKNNIVRNPRYVGPQFPDIEDQKIPCNITAAPTKRPTSRVRNPTKKPTRATIAPTIQTKTPTHPGTKRPTSADTKRPTPADTRSPTSADTKRPTPADTRTPTRGETPTKFPTNLPKTHAPTRGETPTKFPTDLPKTHAPTRGETPTKFPTNLPKTHAPTRGETPTKFPTDLPKTHAPTRGETPTKFPTNLPKTHAPTRGETPTKFPTNLPKTHAPTRGETPTPPPSSEHEPTRFPTKFPTDPSKTHNPTRGVPHTPRPTRGETPTPPPSSEHEPTRFPTKFPTDPSKTHNPTRGVPHTPRPTRGETPTPPPSWDHEPTRFPTKFPISDNNPTRAPVTYTYRPTRFPVSNPTCAPNRSGHGRQLTDEKTGDHDPCRDRKRLRLSDS